jgi:putative ABC transport system permease protein
MRDRIRVFSSVAAYEGAGFTITGVGDAVRIDAATVSLDFFNVLGTPAALGRTFVAGEDTPDDNRVSVISHALWQRLFNGDPKVIGRSMMLNGNPTTVVGVMPPEFSLPVRTDVWVPLRLDPTVFSCWCLSMIGRLKPGFSSNDAAMEIANAVDDFSLQRPDVFPGAKRGGTRVIAMPLVQLIAGDVRTPLLVLLAAVGALLLIACANIANLLLARAGARAREMVVRCCLGASPSRLAGQLLTESATLAAAGAIIGITLAAICMRVVRQMPQLQMPRVDQVRMDAPVALIAIAIAVVCALMFGLAPAMCAARVDLQTSLNDGARGSSSGSVRRLSDGFVIVQFALSLLLLSASGLLIKSFVNLLAVDTGFDAENVLVARMQTPYPRYGSDTVVRAFYERVLERTAAIPGVRAVGLSQRPPLTRGNPQDNIIAEGKEPLPGEPVVVSNLRFITPGFFDAMRTPILRGRGFNASDGPGAPRVVIVDETFAKRFWPNGSALGKRVKYDRDTTSAPWLTVVGVVPNVRQTAIGEPLSLQVYQPYAQRTVWTMYLVVRSSVEPRSLLPAIRAQVAAVDPEIPLYEVHTMEEAVSQSLATRRLTNMLLTSFAVAAFVLAAIGIYGVISLGVASRRREFGVRLALGASPSNVIRLVLQQGAWLAIAGIAIGLFGAAWVARFLSGLLYEVTAFDIPTFLLATVLLAGVAAIACLIPAHRATRVDPVTALRE